MTSTERRMATSSVNDGLDFGCQLLQQRVSDYGRLHPDRAVNLLTTLCFYVETRYVGEPFLALEALTRLAHEVDYSGDAAEQFWAQVRWLADAMQLPDHERDELKLPPVRVTLAGPD